MHGTTPDDVHFHEVGALDSIADVVGVSACAHHLAAGRVVCSPIALGGGRARTAHGSIPVPGPAVTELLRRHAVPAYGGPLDVELATPTGVALVAVLADEFGPMPALVPAATGSGAGARDPEGHANLLRVVVGAAPPAPAALPVEPATVLEANVDDLDPRLWPAVLTLLLDAGADDAWLTPIVMKKGRPAHTVAVLCAPGDADRLARLLLAHTTTIGLRRRQVEKTPLERETVTVEVHGSSVRVKVARLDGEVVNVNPEYDDVARTAAESGRPAKIVLAEAQRAAAGLWDGGGSSRA
ncbi:LarC family nickel insertion protein [Nocardioides sp. TF02-7]|uniref:LarC family nickel insertion protein n=1 Tax=Nocardioides sp. TF02-7 TaxID=2917724 RepID=UPI0023DA9E1B|nr:LarC family nickel insertion protein [Nocardioides sp. TF02-7]